MKFECEECEVFVKPSICTLLFCQHKSLKSCLFLSMAGEFFPEAAQIAYKMWEISATTKIQVGVTHVFSQRHASYYPLLRAKLELITVSYTLGIQWSFCLRTDSIRMLLNLLIRVLIHCQFLWHLSSHSVQCHTIQQFSVCPHVCLCCWCDVAVILYKLKLQDETKGEWLKLTFCYCKSD